MKRCGDEVDASLNGKKACVECIPNQLLVKPSQVPEYLRESEFYKSLNIEDDEEFHISSNLMKQDMNVLTLDDVCDLLETVRFWGANASLLPILDVALMPPFEEIVARLSGFESEFPLVRCLLHVLKGGCSIGAAVECGNMDILRFLDKKASARDYSVNTAAEHGSLACLKYFIEHGGVWHHWASHAAALNGNTACLQYILEHGCPFLLDSYSPNQLLKYRKRFRIAHGPAELAEVTAQSGHYDCVRLLVLHGCQLTRNLTTYLTSATERELLQLVVERGIAVSLDAGVRFTKVGDLEGLKYALEHGCERSTQLLCAAAFKGHLPCLSYAHNQGCSWHEDVCIDAARGGHLNCLQYARAHGCPWNHMVLVEAQKRRHTGIVDYAKANNCPTERPGLRQRK